MKVFAIQDPSLPLKTYQDQLTDIKNRLVTAPNVLPFHHSILTDKASLLIRQFIKDNLYDRIRLGYTVYIVYLTNLRCLKAVFSTIQDKDFDASLSPLIINCCYNHGIIKLPNHWLTRYHFHHTRCYHSNTITC